MKTKFVLNRRKNALSNEKQQLEIYIYENGKKMYKSTGIKLLPDEWDAKNQKVIKRPDRKKLNHDLISIKSMVELDPDSAISVHQLDREGVEYKDLNRYFTHSLSNDFRIGVTTYVDQKRTLDLLNEFGFIKFRGLTHKLLVDFDRFLNRKGFAKSTIAKHHKNLRKFVKQAYRDRLIDRDPYEYFRFDYQSSNTHIYLSLEELDRMMVVKDLTENEKRVRDVFMISAYTALRYSDVIRLDETYLSWRNNKPYIKLITHKQNEFVVIPANPIIIKIFDYYHGFPKLSRKDNDFFNKNIKEVARKAGIDEPIQVIREVAGERQILTKPKYELVHMHTARRSGATNMFLSGIPAINIMKITGHNTESSFMQYIKIEKQENAELIKDNPFFNRKPPKD